MSHEALRWARDLRVSAAQKCLLWALSDAANEAGECWPSMAALCLWTSLSERAVQAAIRGLCERGAIEIVAGGGRGRTTRYRVLVGAVLRPETPQQKRGFRAATPQEVRGISAATPRLVRGIGGDTPHMPRGKRPETPHLLLPLPSKTPQQLRGEPPTLSSTDSGEGISRGEVGSAPRAARGARLAPDWWPDAEQRSFAANLGLDVDWVAAQFRDHWHAKPGKDGVMLDWRATWRGWCRRQVEFDAKRRGSAARRGGGRSLASWDADIFGVAPPDEADGPIIDMAAEG